METIEKENQNDVLHRIKTIEDVLRELGDDDQEVIIYKKLASLFDAESHIVNYQLAVVIIRALNEKREPNWDDSNEYKYTLYFVMGGSSGFRCDDYDHWHSYSDVGSRLCFMERRLAIHAVEQPEFLKVFKNFMTIKK